MSGTAHGWARADGWATASRQPATSEPEENQVEKELEGKAALVTGSGRNLGRAIVLELAARGADVIVKSRSNLEEAESTAKAARELGAEALVVIGDVSRQETIDEIVARGAERFGAVDISVSNAALRPYQSFLETPIEDWLRILDTQLNASFRLAKAVVPGMIAKRWGRIIHITGPDAFIGMAWPTRAASWRRRGPASIPAR
jgi:3-oxoacyl-[acyl-carrier protein] reductase